MALLTQHQMTPANHTTNKNSQSRKTSVFVCPLRSPQPPSQLPKANNHRPSPRYMYTKMHVYSKPVQGRKTIRGMPTTTGAFGTAKAGLSTAGTSQTEKEIPLSHHPNQDKKPMPSLPSEAPTATPPQPHNPPITPNPPTTTPKAPKIQTKPQKNRPQQPQKPVRRLHQYNDNTGQRSQHHHGRIPQSIHPRAV